MKLKPCRYCGGKAEEYLLTGRCACCGARTRNYTAMGGEYQREKVMAERAWNDGYYWPKDDPKWSEKS